MATGYLVTLGNGSLDDADFISGSQSTFTIDTTVGTGSWIWSGVWDGDGITYNGVQDTGVYYTGSDGNVYFIPDTWFTTSGTAEAEAPPAYSAADGIVTGTAGNDVIDNNFTDVDGDTITTGGDIINAAGGDDTVFGSGGNDSIDGGDGADFIVGDQTLANDGQDNISGGAGNDTIYGDTAAGTHDTPTFVSWEAQGAADETSVAGGATATSADGNINVTLSVDAEANFYGASVETGDALFDYNAADDTSSLAIEGGDIPSGGTIGNTQDAAIVTLDFSAAQPGYSDEVSDVTFGIFDIDDLAGQFIDQVIVTAYDADGNTIPVTVTLGSTTTLTSTTNADGSQTVTSVVGSGGAGATDSQTGFASFSVVGPVSYIEIDYNNIDTAYGAHAIRIGDVELTPIPQEPTDGNNDTISGDAGDDLIYGQGGDDVIYGGAGFDTAFGGEGNDSLFGLGDNDTLFGGEGSDYVDGDDGADVLFGGAGDDNIIGDAGNDTIFGGIGADSIYAGADDDSVSGGDGNDTVFLDTGNDTFGSSSTEAGNDTVHGGAGDDSINGGADNDVLYGGADNDTLTGGTGDDSLFGGTGDDIFEVSADDNSTLIQGGEDVGDGDIDAVQFSDGSSNQGVTVTATGDEAGTFDFDGTTGAGSYTEIEELNGTFYDDTFNLAADNSGISIDANEGDDIIITGSGDDVIEAGAGADTINSGAGNDTISLGNNSTPDGDQDVIILQDGFGNDILDGFDAPTPDGDGTFTGIDTLDVTGLNDAGGDPVNVNDVTVTDDGSGNAVLSFPNGETVTLLGITPTDADNPFYLNAIGIPLSDGTVEGTAGADTIDAGYTGDPDGDMVDAGDAILPGDTGDDDLIYGYGGNDAISSGLGDDEVYGGTGDDAITIANGAGTDTIEGGEDASGTDVDTLTFTDSVGTEGVAVTMTSDEAGTYTFPTDGGSGTFAEIEQIALTDQNDDFDGVLATGGNTVDGGAGNDILTGSDGDDSFIGGTGNDTLNANQGNDTLDGGDGNDTIFGDQGDDVIDGGIDEDAIFGGDGNDTLTGGDGSDTIIGGADQDVIYGGVGDIINGSETGVDNDTLIVSDVDYIDYDTDPENGTVYFNGGGSLTFTNIENVVVSDRDGTVEGTAGADVIDSTYAGDPDGDFVDNNDAILIGDTGNDDLIYAYGGNDSVTAGAGDDEVYGGDGNDIVDGGIGNDTLVAGIGDDTLIGGIGDDTLDMTAGGNDVAFGGDGTDTITATQAHEIYGGEGDDTVTIQGFSSGSESSVFGEGGNDTLNGTNGGQNMFGGAGNDTIYGGNDISTFDVDTLDGGDGDDVIISGAIGPAANATFQLRGDVMTGGAGNDTLIGGAGNDTMSGGTENDSIEGGDGDDVIVLEDNFGTDNIAGGETVETNGDTLDASAVTSNLTVDLETLGAGNPEDGTISDGTSTTTFAEIENIILGSGDDSVTGSSGVDTIDLGSGADTFDGGAGDDTVDLGSNGAGSPDGDQDVVVLQDGFGNDTISNFDAPTPNGDGTFTGIDTLDVTALLDAGGDPVNVNDVTVTDDGSGNALLTFPNGETLVLTGITPTDADNPFYLNAIGIPLSDGTVEGTAGDDIIDAGYTGDPDGDMVDAGDAILAGDVGDDDLIYAYDGNDSVTAGAGDDEVYGGIGNDTIDGGIGDDILNTGTGSDVAYGGAGNDSITSAGTEHTIFGGDGDDSINITGFTNNADNAAYGDAGNDTLNGGNGLQNLYGGAGNDTIFGGDDFTTFDVDTLDGGDGDDVIISGAVGTAANATFQANGDIMTGGAGNDTLIGGAADDQIFGGADNDSIEGGFGADTIEGGTGDDTIDGGLGNDVITGGTGNDNMFGGTGTDTFVLGEGFGTDTITAGEDVSQVDVDIVDAGSMTSDVTLDFTGPEAGTLSDGTNTATFTEVELFTLGSGDDTVVGGDGDELVFAGSGNDTMTGGTGTDTFYGGTGDDDITFAEGDAMYGGSGDDTFTLEDLGETSNGTITIDGGAGGETPDPDGTGPLTGGDTLNLSGLTNLTQAVRDTFVDDGTGSFSGSVTLNDGTILNFSEIENIICFTPQTRIATPKGLVAIEDLEVGDLVVTRDHGLQAIRWIEGRSVPARDRFAPIKISKNVLAGQDRDLIVSPQHRVLFQGYRAELLFGESEVLVAAKHLVDGLDVTQDEAAMVTYVHMLFDQHEIIYAEGAATESFHPGDIGFSAVGEAAREELFAIFPELRVDPRHYGATARRCLKDHEAKLIRT